MIWRCSLFKLSMYFLSWKYRWFSYFSHLTKEILLWCHASLQSASIIWAANLSLISTYFHNVWVKMSAKSSSRFRMSWFSWNLTSLMLNSSISRFMKTRICKSAEIIKNKCNWTEFKMMICDWNFMTLMLKTSKMRFLIIIIIIINSYTFVTLIKSTHEKLYATCIKWTKLSEVENHSQSIRLLHAVETVSFKTMYQICSRWLHVKEWVF